MPTKTTLDWVRDEHTCFVDGQIRYEIVCEVRWGRRSSSYEEPDDPTEVDILEVVRFDPIDGTAVKIDSSDWPFTPQELNGIEERAIEESVDYG